MVVISLPLRFEPGWKLPCYRNLVNVLKIVTTLEDKSHSEENTVLKSAGDQAQKLIFS